MGFLDTGWLISGGIIVPPAHVDPWTAYRFVQEAIYDGHLPVTRIIGYHITTSKSAKTARSSRIIERDQNCADDRLTIASNLSNIVLIDYAAPKAHIEEHSGIWNVSAVDFTYSRKKLNVLTTQDYMLTSLTGVSLDLALQTNTGYRDANENYERIMSSRASTTATMRTRYFPLFSYHNVMDFVSVLPYDGSGTIVLRYYFGMNDNYLLQMFEQLFEKKPDVEWCRGYQEILV